MNKSSGGRKIADDNTTNWPMKEIPLRKKERKSLKTFCKSNVSDLLAVWKRRNRLAHLIDRSFICGWPAAAAPIFSAFGIDAVPRSYALGSDKYFFFFFLLKVSTYTDNIFNIFSCFYVYLNFFYDFLPFSCGCSIIRLLRVIVVVQCRKRPADNSLPFILLLDF